MKSLFLQNEIKPSEKSVFYKDDRQKKTHRIRIGKRNKRFNRSACPKVLSLYKSLMNYFNRKYYGISD